MPSQIPFHYRLECSLDCLIGAKSVRRFPVTHAHSNSKSFPHNPLTDLFLDCDSNMEPYALSDSDSNRHRDTNTNSQPYAFIYTNFDFHPDSDTDFNPYADRHLYTNYHPDTQRNSIAHPNSHFHTDCVSNVHPVHYIYANHDPVAHPNPHFHADCDPNVHSVNYFHSNHDSIAYPNPHSHTDSDPNVHPVHDVHSDGDSITHINSHCHPDSVPNIHPVHSVHTNTHPNSDSPPIRTGTTHSCIFQFQRHGYRKPVICTGTGLGCCLGKIPRSGLLPWKRRWVLSADSGSGTFGKIRGHRFSCL